MKEKEKKKVKKAATILLRDSTPSPLGRARREAEEENKLRKVTWLQRQRNLAIGVGTSKPRSSSISQVVEQHFVVIEEANPPFEMRKIAVPSEQLAGQIG